MGMPQPSAMTRRASAVGGGDALQERAVNVLVAADDGAGLQHVLPAIRVGDEAARSRTSAIPAAMSQDWMLRSQ